MSDSKKYDNLVTTSLSSSSLSDRQLMPPPCGPIRRKDAPAKRKKTVLDEDEYTNALEVIIERDFFPELTKQRHSADADTLESLAATIKQNPSITLDKFVGNYISEDNQSFDELQEKDVKARRKKLHWMYEPQEKDEKSGMLMLYYMNGQKLSVEDRKKFDSNLEIADGDSRPNGPDLWHFRVRNQLMFPPELNVSEEVSRVTQVEGN